MLTRCFSFPARSLLPGAVGHEPPTSALLNAIFDLWRTGRAWRLLPHDFPPPGTVSEDFRAWSRDGTLRRVHDTLRRRVRVAAGRDQEPSAACLDSQAAKTNEPGGIDGPDAGQKMLGRQRHLLVDTLGLILAVVVPSAGIQDRDGAKAVLAQIRNDLPGLQLVWADGGYAGQSVGWVKGECGWILGSVQRADDVRGFKLLPRRRVVERTSAGLGRFRRMSKDYESHPETSGSIVHLAMIKIMVRRLTAA